MFESIIIDILVLTCVTLLLIVVFVLFRLVWLKAEVDRLKQVLQGAIKKVVSTDRVCQHHLGHLNFVSKGKPIPSECMGCPDVFECLAHKEK